MKESLSHFSFSTRRLVLSALIIACYITLVAITAGFAFGAIQVRLATALYSLSYLFPFLVFPLGLANMLSNLLFGSLGLIDVIGGTIVGLITPACIYAVRKWRLPLWFIAVPIILIPGLGVPLYLHYLLQVPYWPLALSLLLGQVVPAVLGYLLVKALKKRKEVLNV